MASSVLRKIALYEQQNRVAAAIILADVERYGGKRSCAVTWARAFLARVERERRREVDGSSNKSLCAQR
jgi:hypothetical protein